MKKKTQKGNPHKMDATEIARDKIKKARKLQKKLLGGDIYKKIGKKISKVLKKKKS
tara:strand:+ start:468 stop:635 length:168 start_codon:yes stop_codon:yes gene_type:complete